MASAVSSPVESRSPGSSSSGPSRVRRLRGLPWEATVAEINDFFSGYAVDEVYICRHDGRATGEAYVSFSDAAQARKAMDKRQKEILGHRYIEIFEATEDDLAAVKRTLEDPLLQGFVVRLRGLPYAATEEDVGDFLEGVPLAEAEDAIVFDVPDDVGRPSGTCFVEVANAAALEAVWTKHKELMGDRYIEVIGSSKTRKLQAQQEQLVWGFSNPRRMAVVAWEPTLALPRHVRQAMRRNAQPAAPGGMRPVRPRAMQPHAPHMQPPVPRGMQPVRPRSMQPIRPCDIQPAMPPETQLAVVAAAAAAGSRVTCEVGQLASTLQGTHLGGSVASSATSPTMQQQQQQQLYAPTYPRSHMTAPLHVTCKPLPAPDTLLDTSGSSSSRSSSSSSSSHSFSNRSSSSFSNSSSHPSISGSLLSLPSVTGSAMPAAEGAYYHGVIPAASAVLTQPGATVLSPSAAYGNVMLYAPAPAPVQAPMQQQQLLTQVYCLPVQQGAMPGLMQGPMTVAYNMPAPAYIVPAPVYSVPASYPAAAAAAAAAAAEAPTMPGPMQGPMQGAYIVPAPAYLAPTSYSAAAAAAAVDAPTMLGPMQGAYSVPAPAHSAPAPTYLVATSYSAATAAASAVDAPTMPGPMQGAYSTPAPGYSTSKPAYSMPTPAYSMPPLSNQAAAAVAAEAPTMASTSHPTTMLVAGAQWLHTPAHYPAPSWLAPAAAASYAADSGVLTRPASGMGPMQ